MTDLHDLDTERALLASVLVVPVSLPRILTEEGLRPDHFHSPIHAEAFKAMIDVNDRGAHLDHVTVTAELKHWECIDAGVFVTDLYSIAEPLNFQQNSTDYAKRIRAFHRRRELATAAKLLWQAADQDDPQKLADAERMLTTPAELEQSSWSAEQRKDMYFDRLNSPAAEKWGWPFGKLNAWTAGGVRRKQIVLIGGWTAMGKALDVSTPIPTPNGWRSMLDLKTGDEVFDENGRPIRILATSEVQLGRSCSEVVFADGSRIVADDQHRWLTWTEAARRSEATAARAPRSSKYARDQQDLRVRPAVRTTAEIAASLAVKSRGGRANHSIPLCRALGYPTALLPIDPYVLGAWLGDGNSRHAAITCDDPEILGHIAAAGHEIRPHADPIHFGIGGLRRHLRRLGLLRNKHVPRAYLEADPSQRLSLLQGLMDTDGTVGTVGTGRCEFTSTNRDLADAVLELAIGLGIRATLIKGRAMLEGRDCGPKYRVGFLTGIPVFRLARKLVRLPSTAGRASYRSIVDVRAVSSRAVKCIQVDSEAGLFLAGHSCIPTHNSVLFDQILEHLAGQGLRVHSYINEMSERERSDRTLARLSRLPFSKIYAGELDKDQRTEAIVGIGRFNVGLTECEGWTADEIARHIRWNRWDVAGVDVVHEIPHSDERDLAGIAQTLRAAAKQADCILIACVHLNDQRITSAQRPRPVLRDVRGTGMLVRGADVVLFVHRDDDEDGVPTAEGTLIAAKIRNGSPKAMGVVFEPQNMRFLAKAGDSQPSKEW